MAAKKPATGKTLAKWDEELARRANVAAEIEANVGGSQFLSTRGGILKYKDNPVPGNKMNVIVLNHIIEYAYYEGKFDPDNPRAPICFAFGTDEKKLAPHEKSQTVQNEVCKGCPQNEWASADTGQGKACKNIRRLALVPQDALDDIEAAEVAMIKVPVTSVRAWAGYVKNLKETLKRPTCAVVTEISLVPDTKDQFHMQFRLIEKIEGELIGALLEKADKVLPQLNEPYVYIDEAERPARGRGRDAKAGKAASRAVAKGARR